jgi:hypothetical protein
MSELSNIPSEVSTAFLNESINALTCGSLQMLDVLVPGRVVPEGGVTVTPGRGVTAPGVSVRGNGVAVVDNVAVAGAGGG